MSNKMERRDFLKMMGAGAGAVGAASIGLDGKTFTPDNAPDRNPVAQTSADEMDAHHEEGVQAFLDNIGSDPDFWGKPMEFTMDGDTKVFEITVSRVDWETEPGKVFNAMAYNGTIPGPVIRVTEGDNCRFVVTNEMDESTTIHWHGLLLPNNMDGVPYINQPPIKPGESFTYEFVARNPGSHMYHSHHNSAEQVTKGLLGAFIIDPQDTSREPEVDAEFIFVLNDSALGFTINGKSFPYTQPIITNLGQKIRIRYMNEGLMIHPMHLHGLPQLVIAKDGWPLPVPHYADTINIAPGERYDVIVDCTEPGVWAYHCHILTHAETRNGMFGMVTALVVNEE